MLSRLSFLGSNWYDLLIAALWIILVAYWVISAASAKRTISGGWVWWREIGLRLVLLGLVLVVLRLTGSNGALAKAGIYLVNRNMLLGLIGAVLCALGVGLAIWARVYLGRNWDMAMSRKENPDMVTTGPYAYVRHPIYAGFLLAMLGSAIGQSVIWLVMLIVTGVYFTFAARREEMNMLEQFPEQYRTYKERTKMLVPFIW